MIVAMMQPAFLPWQGFFGLLASVDRFILLDDFQFSVQSYHQRNRLFVSPGKVDWCTAHVLKSASFAQPLNRTLTNEKVPWRRKLWKRIQQNYRRAAFFERLGADVEQWLLRPATSLATQNMEFIRWAARLMGFDAELRLSSERPSDLTRSDRVVDLLRWGGATTYRAARGSFGYMKEDGVFPVADLPAVFQDFQPQPYLQVGSPSAFVPCLSVLDALLNIGPAATARLIRVGTDHWVRWEERVAGDEPAASSFGVAPEGSI